MVNTTTMSKTSFHDKIFSGPCGAKDPGNITARKFHSTKHKTMFFIYKKNAQQGREVYASSGSRSNRSATARVASSTSTLVASAGSLMGPCTTGSREMLGSRLWKHISTCLATACAKAWPSSTRRLLTASSSWDIFVSVESRSGSTVPASGVTSSVRTGMKLKDAKAASAWPKKL
jgi:hypothetical protein